MTLVTHTHRLFLYRLLIHSMIKIFQYMLLKYLKLTYGNRNSILSHNNCHSMTMSLKIFCRPTQIHSTQIRNRYSKDVNKYSTRGIEPVPPAMEVWSLNHWTTKHVPQASVSNDARVLTAANE